MATTHIERTYYEAELGESVAQMPLCGPLKVDVCVVGGGFTGLGAALALAKKGAQVALIEAGSIGHAASGRNGGQLHSGYVPSQTMLTRWLGADHARALWDLAEAAKQLVRDLIDEHGIDCGLKNGLVIAADDRAAARTLASETDDLRTRYGYTQAKMLSDSETAALLGTDIYPVARLDMGGGHLQPLALARGLAAAAQARGVRIFEHTCAKSLETSPARVRVSCAGGTLEADKVIIACDVGAGRLVPALAPFVLEVESFIAVTSVLPAELAARVLPSDVAVADTRHVLDYYRKTMDGRLLFGGRASYFAVPENVREVVRPRIEHVFPMLKGIALSHAWSGAVGVSRTGMPHLGRIGERVLFGHGYSGHGVALANLGGALLAEALMGQNERFDVLAAVRARPFARAAWARRLLIPAGLFWYRLCDLV
ncbi:MAG: FAD-binding oxidoreductase [Alphaproteobacteria bacterium]|nr:FAD-binding oxidoreductase [Alphaproteobacteria bacterium]